MNSESYNSQSNSEGGAPLTLENIAKMLEGQPEPEPPISKWFEDSHPGDIIYEYHRGAPTAHFTHQTPPFRGGNLDRGHGRGRSSNRSRGPGRPESFRSNGSQFAPRGGQQNTPYNPPQGNRNSWQQAHMEAPIRFGPIEQQYGPNNVPPPPPPPPPGSPQGYWNRNTPSQQSNTLKRGSESQHPYPDRKKINRSGSPNRPRDELGCAACGGLGHELKRCMESIDHHGFLLGCPRCQTVDHPYELCPNPRKKAGDDVFYRLKMRNNKPPLAHSQDIREMPEFWQKDYRPWTPDAALYALERFNEGLGGLDWRKEDDRDPTWDTLEIIPDGAFSHPDVRAAIDNHPAYNGNGTIDSKVPPEMIVHLQEQNAALELEVKELRETLGFYQELFGFFRRDDWVPDEDLNVGDSVSVFGLQTEEREIGEGQMDASNSQQMDGANDDRPPYVSGEHNGPTKIKQENNMYGMQIDGTNDDEHSPPRDNRQGSSGRGGGVTGGGNTTSTKYNRLGSSTYTPQAQQSQRLPSQPNTSTFGSFKPSNSDSKLKVPLMADSAFGGTYTPQTRQSQPSKSTLGSFKPGNPDSKPKVPLMVDSAFGDYNHLNRNVVAPQTQKMQPSTSTFGSFKPGNLNTELQQRRPIIEDSAFSGYNRLAGSTNSGSPQPSQSQHRLPSSTRSIVRQPNVPLNTTTTTFGEFKPPPPQGGSPQRAPDNIIEVEEEEEISQPSTSVPRPPKPIVSVIGNLLGDPNSPGALKGRAKAEIMRAKAKGPLPPTIQPKILPNGRKAGVFIDQEKKFRTTGVLQYFDAGCFNCGGGDHEGSVCKKGCYRCGKDHPLPQCPYNM